jgi:hypothetical protein
MYSQSIAIKNTFIAVQEERPVVRRSSTVFLSSNSSLWDEDVIEKPFVLPFFFKAPQIDSPIESPSCSTVSSEKPSKRVRQITRRVQQCKVEESDYTTVMIRNIPSRYSPEWLSEEVQAIAPCNFIHMPKARRSDLNLGYAFVNFETQEGARLFLEEFEGYQFIRQPRSLKRASVSFAALQGFQANVDFYSSTKIAAKLGRAPWVKASA